MDNFSRRLMMQEGGGKYLTNRDPSVVTTLDIVSLLSPISYIAPISLEFVWLSEEYFSAISSSSSFKRIIEIRGKSQKYLNATAYLVSSQTIPSLGYIRFGTNGYNYPVMTESKSYWGARAYVKILNSNPPWKLSVYYYNTSGKLRHVSYDMSQISNPTNYYGDYGATIYSGKVNFYGDMKIGPLTLGPAVLTPTRKDGVCGFLEENSGLFVGSEDLKLTD